MQQIADWLEKLNLGVYAQRFAENDIDFLVLRYLTDQDLERIGVSLGHRRKLLAAIAELYDTTAPSPQPISVERPLAHDWAERRQLTVMFCDLVGSTALSARLDPEELREIIGAYHRCCAEVITRSGGFVAKYLGDGVLAYFGYPQAHEDDADQAVRAGLALVEAVATLDAGQASSLRARVGIATGLVVVGDLLGEGAAREQAVVGETPNLAARLQGLAEPDTVVIGAETRRLLGGLFDLDDLGAVLVKGFGEVQVWRVLGASAIDSRFEALRAASTPLVGREDEIALLMRRWQQAEGGDGCAVLIAGEPGIGKSRIAQAVSERLNTQPHTRLRYFCSPHHQDSALYPSITQLERAAGFRRRDTAEQRLDKLRAVLAQGTNDLSEAVPLLAALLSIQTGDRYPTLKLTPQKRKERTLQTLVAQVEGLADRQPVLIVFEDLHWSDPSTQELLDLLIERVPRLRVLVLLTFRPEFTPPWIGAPHVIQLSLDRLPPASGTEMITRLTGGKALPREITDQIVKRTDGVPLFIEELTKSVLESGLLKEADGRYASSGPISDVAIPMTLHASLLARLDRLAPTREVAQIAAALGRQFSYELMSAVAQMPQTQLRDGLGQLVSAELMFQRGAPPDAEYTFKHALVQDAAYSTLLRSRRQQLHGRIAIVLESKFPDIVTSQPALVAQHCAEAGLTEKAVDYWLRAGQQALAKCAISEAAAQLRKGLTVLSSIQDSAARREQELNLQITLGKALLALKGYAAVESGEAFVRARQLCEELGQSAQLGHILYGQFVFHLIRGELAPAEQFAKEISALGDAGNDDARKYLGLSLSGCVCWWLGRFTDAQSYYNRALPLWNPIYRARASAPHDAYVAHLIYLSEVLLCLGHFTQARSRREEALVEARQLSPYNLVYALRHAWYGDWATDQSPKKMLRSADEMLAISREQGFPMFLGVGNIMRGWCLCAEGRSEEGIQLMLQGIDSYAATGAVLVMPFYLMTLAQAYGTASKPQEGLDRLDQASKLVEISQECWAVAEMHRLRGTLLLSLQDQDAGEKSYRQALEVARGQNAKLWELRAATSLASLWHNQGRSKQAHDVLVPFCDWFTDGFEVPALNQAKALLDELR
jgi:class 3 adenylate cyclase/tetratricopeptide (TPR) repeat protein